MFKSNQMMYHTVFTDETVVCRVALPARKLKNWEEWCLDKPEQWLSAGNGKMWRLSEFVGLQETFQVGFLKIRSRRVSVVECVCFGICVLFWLFWGERLK